MNFRRAELEHFGSAIHWMDDDPAKDTFEQWITFAANDRYGLHAEKVVSIEHADADEKAIDSWLETRCAGDAILVIFARDAVLRTDIRFFLHNWRDMLCPSRDDALIVSPNKNWIMFYCHEDEFEYGQIDM
ncbi:MAG: hypothetical protein JNL67_15180 [Planctomycetaceae bacterium]|nr:hypothetical protein [Planctomycetaceae bacterium]